MDSQRTTWWLGVDVSKATLDCARSDREETWQVPNTEEGWATITTAFAEQPPAGIVMEATGALHIGLHFHVQAAGWHSSSELDRGICAESGPVHQD